MPNHKVATAKINKALSKDTSLAKKEEKSMSLATTGQLFKSALELIATVLSDRAITPIKLTETYDLIRTYSKHLKKMEDLAKDHLKKLVVATGVQGDNPDSKQKFLTIGDTRIEIRPVNTKLDQKKVLAMLTEKSIPLTKGMDEEISYRINESKLAALIASKKITHDELEACRHELTYSLQPPKKLSDPVEEEARD